MAIYRPDEYGHNNPDLAFTDSNSVRGGRRVVANLTQLFSLLAKVDQLKQNVTIVRVLDADGLGNAKEYRLSDITKVHLAAGWTEIKTGATKWSDINEKPLINNMPPNPDGSYTVEIVSPVRWSVKPTIVLEARGDGTFWVKVTVAGEAIWDDVTVPYGVGDIGAFLLTVGDNKRIDSIVAKVDGTLAIKTGPENTNRLIHPYIAADELETTFYIVTSTDFIDNTSEIEALKNRVTLLETQDNTGPAGADGLSAYQVWIEAGNTGNVEDFMLSLKGDPGIQGEEGLSAYEVWLAQGNVGTEADYLLSLKGVKGDTAQALLDYEIIVTNTNGQVLPNGTVLPQGMPLTDLWRKVLVKEIFPSYLQPSASLTSTVSGIVEKGTTINPSLTPSFTKGDAGDLVSYFLKRNNVVLDSDTILPITFNVIADSYTMGVEQITYRVEFSYGQGEQKYGTEGTAAPGRIPAGTKTADQIIIGVLPWFYGSNDNGGIPIVYSSNKVIEIIGTSIQVPSFGTGIKFLWFAVPKGTKTFTKWQRTALDAGSIGGSTNLFNSKTLVSVTSTGRGLNWTEEYDLYMSNYATDANVLTTLS